MTYLAFLIYFLLPPIVLIVGWAVLSGSTSVLRASMWPVGYVVLIALAYTAPWDNYLIYRDVWWYGADRVLGTIGLVPIEEYGFMVLQSVMTGLLTMMLFRGVVLPEIGRESERGWLGFGMWMLVAVAGWLMWARGGSTLYLGLILGWAGPVLGGLWWLGAPRYRVRRRTFWLAAGLPTVYLWNADALAIDAGIWEISEAYTVGLNVGPLPLEEAVFFVVTNLLVVKGVTLFRIVKIL